MSPRALILLLALTTSASAAPATPEEASRLTHLFESYVGVSTPPASPTVTVSPQGEGYRAAFDVTRIASPLGDFGVSLVAAEPLVLALTPQPDGTWHVTRAGLPSFGITTKKGVSYSVQLDGFGSDGVFDPRIESFTRLESTLGTVSTSTVDRNTDRRSVTVQDGKVVAQSRGTDSHDVETAIHRGDGSLTQEQHVRRSGAGTAAPPRDLDVTVKVARSSSDLTATHQNVGALLDLWAFLVAHPSRAQLSAVQPEFRIKALAAIPYAASVLSRSGFEDATVTFNGGSGHVGHVGWTFALDAGDAPDGFGLSLHVADLQTSAKTTMPAWLASLVPENLDVSLRTTPLDVSATLRTLVEGTDLAADTIPPSVVATAMAKLGKGGDIGVELLPSTVSNQTVQLAASGKLSGFGPTAKAAATVEVKGLDDEIVILERSPDPLGSQVAQALSVARALAKPLPDGRLKWDIEPSAGGLVVNGQALR